jgi:hypothetical protein
VGAEPILLLGLDEAEVPTRSALRKVGDVIRAFEAGEARTGPAAAMG